MRLAVELYGTLIGRLEGEAGRFDFTPTTEGMATFGTNSSVLSVAIPLSPAQRRDHAGRRRNWFAELLPEGDQYDYMLAQGGLRRDDTPGFLARYGRDVAGALQVWDLDPTEPKAPAIRAVTSAQVRALLEDPIGSPLANDAQAGKSSLGGVQPRGHGSPFRPRAPAGARLTAWTDRPRPGLPRRAPERSRLPSDHSEGLRPLLLTRGRVCHGTPTMRCRRGPRVGAQAP